MKDSNNHRKMTTTNKVALAQQQLKTLNKSYLQEVLQQTIAINKTLEGKISQLKLKIESLEKIELEAKRTGKSINISYKKINSPLNITHKVRLYEKLSKRIIEQMTEEYLVLRVLHYDAEYCFTYMKINNTKT